MAVLKLAKKSVADVRKVFKFLRNNNFLVFLLLDMFLKLKMKKSFPYRNFINNFIRPEKAIVFHGN